jgi:hypothetical protein
MDGALGLGGLVFLSSVDQSLWLGQIKHESM